MNIRHAACSAALACSALLIGPLASPAAEPRAVIELFTSQGCSSCPAADKLLGELSRDPTLITMSLAVDYWDYLGWKDTLALHGHTSRERAYASARGDREVYTPQVVVNGLAHVLGSDKNAIEQAIAQTRRKALSLPVTLTVADGKVTVTVPAGDKSGEAQTAEVWLCALTGKVNVKITRGENQGNTLTYHNVVRRWVKLGDWTGKAETYSTPFAEVSGPEIDSYAAVVQSGAAAKPGVMLGAAMASAR